MKAKELQGYEFPPELFPEGIHCFRCGVSFPFLIAAEVHHQGSEFFVQLCPDCAEIVRGITELYFENPPEGIPPEAKPQ